MDTAGVTDCSHVLIVGAWGGVGTYALQIAVAMGATVTGVASASKADLVTALSAQHVIDYTRDDFADARTGTTRSWTLASPGQSRKGAGSPDSPSRLASSGDLGPPICRSDCGRGNRCGPTPVGPRDRRSQRPGP